MTVKRIRVKDAQHLQMREAARKTGEVAFVLEPPEPKIRRRSSGNLKVEAQGRRNASALQVEDEPFELFT